MGSRDASASQRGRLRAPERRYGLLRPDRTAAFASAATEQWGRLERELVESAIAVPLVDSKKVAFVSKRVGNFQQHPVLGTLISQLWVR